MNDTLTCNGCGVTVKRTGRNQRYCVDCAMERKKHMEQAWKVRHGLAKDRRASVVLRQTERRIGRLHASLKAEVASW